MKANELMPREKLIKLGVQSLSDKELLAIFLRTGTKDMPVLALSEHILNVFGGIHGILNAPLDAFLSVHGLGVAKFCQLQATSELVRRAFNRTLLEEKAFTDPQLVKNFLQIHFEQTEHERFACLFLNSKNHLIKFDYLFQGSINSAQVYPRTIAQYCLKCNAAAVIFAHNHPSGDVSPSQADQLLTANLKQTLSMIDVDVLDHFVIGFNNCFSMAENGML